MLFPEAWLVPQRPKSACTTKIDCRDDFIAPIPQAERKDMLLAYHAQLNSADEETCANAAKAWTRWECVQNSWSFQCGANMMVLRMWTSKLHVDAAQVAMAENDKFALSVQALRRTVCGTNYNPAFQCILEDREPLFH